MLGAKFCFSPISQWYNPFKSTKMNVLFLLFIIAEGCFWSKSNDAIVENNPVPVSTSVRSPTPVRSPSKPKWNSKKKKSPSTSGSYKAFKDLPPGIKTEKIPTSDPLKCPNMGGNGEPCSHDIQEAGSCNQKQYWSDNGFTHYQVSLLEPSKRHLIIREMWGTSSIWLPSIYWNMSRTLR